jgi:MYND finger
MNGPNLLIQESSRDDDWSKISPYLGRKPHMRVDGELCWLLAEKTKEMLRYYARDGGIAHLPLLHFSPFNQNASLRISLKDTVNFDHCYWCRRCFPEGMMSCTACIKAGYTGTYCGSECQKAAWKVHKRMHETNDFTTTYDPE